MRLIASITLGTPEGDKTFDTTLNLGEKPNQQLQQHALHQTLGQLANMIGLHQGASFKGLKVDVEA